MAKREAPAVTLPTVWLDLDLGDTEVLLREHAHDGLFTLDIDGEQRLLVNADQTAEIARAFVTLAAAKGWR
jgi:hypothetical protein